MITHNPVLTKVGNRVVRIKDGEIENIIVQTPLAVDKIEW